LSYLLSNEVGKVEAHLLRDIYTHRNGIGQNDTPESIRLYLNSHSEVDRIRTTSNTRIELKRKHRSLTRRFHSINSPRRQNDIRALEFPLAAVGLDAEESQRSAINLHKEKSTHRSRLLQRAQELCPVINEVFATGGKSFDGRDRRDAAPCNGDGEVS
jgi:hypothetical protein